MASIEWSGLRRSALTTIRSAVEAAVVGAAVAAAASLIWSDARQQRGLAIGAVAAWAASSLGTGALLAAKELGSLRLFWWAFGGGISLRLGTLVALMAYGYSRDAQLSQPALLMTYAFGVLFFLMLEYRHIKIK